MDTINDEFDVLDDDCQPDPVNDIDSELEDWEKHLEHRCDMFTCFYCGTGGGI